MCWRCGARGSASITSGARGRTSRPKEDLARHLCPAERPAGGVEARRRRPARCTLGTNFEQARKDNGEAAAGLWVKGKATVASVSGEFRGKVAGTLTFLRSALPQPSIHSLLSAQLDAQGVHGHAIDKVEETRSMCRICSDPHEEEPLLESTTFYCENAALQLETAAVLT
eukprot:35104-Chlamydomonas_euryale.AAC.4